MYMTWPPQQQPCPTCGRCPTCGHYGAAPMPWSTYGGYVSPSYGNTTAGGYVPSTTTPKT